jgi:hypothetical protein
MDKDLIPIVITIILGVVIIFITIQECTKVQEERDNIYNLLMQNELEFVDNFIETKYKASGSYYNIIYKENGEIKKVTLSLEQYYNVVEKYQKTIDKE